MCKKKICIMVPSLSGGGAEKVALNLAGNYVRKGYHVDLVVFVMKGPYRACVSNGVNVVDVGAKRTHRSMVGIWRYLKSKRPDYVISVMRDSNVLLGLSLMCLPRFSGKVIYREANTFHGILRMGRLKRTVLKLLMRISYSRADVVIANSNDTKDDLVREGIVDDEEVTVIPNPVVPDNVDALAVEDVDEPWFDQSDLKVILGVGRLHAQKNFQLLIESFAIVHSEDRNTRLIIVGEGEQSAVLSRQIARSGVEDVVKIVPFRLNIYPYYHRSAVFVLTSRWEGFGNVIVEAMSVGTSVVSVNCPGGPRMILEEGKYGMLVDNNSPVAMAEAIKEALQQIPQFDRKAHMDRARRFSISSVADNYLKAP